MLFNSKEVADLISALETYNDAPRNNLRYELQNQLVTSSIKKLENLSAITFFTKQEFSVMAFALESVIDSLEISGYVVDRSMRALYSKLVKLATPTVR